MYKKRIYSENQSLINRVLQSELYKQESITIKGVEYSPSVRTDRINNLEIILTEIVKNTSNKKVEWEKAGVAKSNSREELITYWYTLLTDNGKETEQLTTFSDVELLVIDLSIAGTIPEDILKPFDKNISPGFTSQLYKEHHNIFMLHASPQEMNWIIIKTLELMFDFYLLQTH